MLITYRPDCFIAFIFMFGKKVSPRRFAMTARRFATTFAKICEKISDGLAGGDVLKQSG